MKERKEAEEMSEMFKFQSLALKHLDLASEGVDIQEILNCSSWRRRGVLSVRGRDVRCELLDGQPRERLPWPVILFCLLELDRFVVLTFAS